MTRITVYHKRDLILTFGTPRASKILQCFSVLRTDTSIPHQPTGSPPNFGDYATNGWALT